MPLVLPASYAYVILSLSHEGACNDRAVDDTSVMIICIT